MTPALAEGMGREHALLGVDLKLPTHSDPQKIFIQEAITVNFGVKRVAISETASTSLTDWKA